MTAARRASRLPAALARSLALLAVLLPAAGPAPAQTKERTCSWRQVRPEAFYDGPCTVEVTAQGARVRAGNLRFFIREDRRRDGWTLLRLDGKPAIRHETGDGRTAYATLDLNEFLDIGP